MSSIRNEAKSLDIRHLKLVTGEEIIALVSKTKDNYYVIEIPLLLVQVYEGNSYSFQFKEWFPLSDDNVVTMNKGHVISLLPVDLDTKEQYLKTVINIAIKNVEEMDPSYSELVLPENTTLH